MNSTNDPRPGLQLFSPAESAEWLRVTAGTGPLSGLFHRNGRIVHCLRVGTEGYIPPEKEEDDDGPAQVWDITVGGLTAEIQYTYNVFKVVEDAEGNKRKVRAMFSKEAAKLGVDAPHHLTKIRPLRGVIHVPIVRKDGTVIDTPGYDDDSRLLYLPDAGLSVPAVSATPTAGEVAAARDLILEMLAGFDFQTDHDGANAVGLLVTPLLRLLAPPAWKLFAIGAPQPGSGKSLLAQVARILHGGVFRSEMPHDDAELEKTLGSILTCTTAPVVQFDNVTGVLRSSRLAGMLTSAKYSGRVLGSTNSVDMTNDRVWTVTGNNLQLGGDMVRRAVQITIDPKCPNPEERTDFAIANLPEWVTEHRGELVAALLTLVRAWVAAGRPLRSRAGSDSYAEWVRTVDGILGNAGIVGTFDHVDSKRVTVGTDDQEWAEFLDAVRARFSDDAWTVKTMLEAVAMPPGGGDDEFSRANEAKDRLAGRTIPLDALPAELAEKVMRGRMGATIVAKSLGRWLANREGRYAGGRVTVRSTGMDRNKVKLWAVEVLAGGPVEAPVEASEPTEDEKHTAAWAPHQRTA